MAIARQFAARNWQVGLGDLPVADPIGAAAAIGGSVRGFALDVTSEDDWRQSLAAFTAPNDGRLDLLINNAGILRFGQFVDQSVPDLMRQVAVNLGGVVLGARIGLHHLRRTRDSFLVNIASAAAWHASPRLAAYSATKFAVRGLSEALDIELAPLGVRVACISPFLVDTPMMDDVDPAGRRYRDAAADQPMLTARAVADAVWVAVHQDRLHHPVGEASHHLVQEAARRLDIFRSRARPNGDAMIVIKEKQHDDN